MNHSVKVRLIATGILIAGLAACGGDDGAPVTMGSATIDNSISPGEASALVSTTSEVGEPQDVSQLVLVTSETDEPFDLAD